MRSKKLKNAPLKEAIFELVWNSPLDKTGFPVDKQFELALGKFDSNIREYFPFHKRILPPNAPIKIYGRPLHQFWSGNITWPVVQLGPGILTVNDTDKNYEWEGTYRPNIHTATRALLKSYEAEMVFNKVSLKYIDTIDFTAETNIIQFISSNLQTEVLNKFTVPGELAGININQVFTVDGSQVVLNIQTAVNNLNGSKALVWITAVEKTGNFAAAEVLEWLDNAHAITSDLFIKMLTSEFYDSFNK